MNNQIIKPEREYTAWNTKNNIYKPLYMNNPEPPVRQLPVGLYDYQYNYDTRESYLVYKDNKFSFQHEIYHIDDFNDIVIKSYHERNITTGVLFNGYPGTGKTVHAKLLANASNLPIVSVTREPDMFFLNLMSKVSQPICWVFDEFEKYVHKNETVMLSILDGMGKTDIPHLFIFTTNTLNINDRFLGRPSRIRYIKTFDTLPEEFFKTYITDNLKDPSLFDDVISYVKDNMTIDVVKSVVEEVNAIGFNKDILDTLNIKTH